jgi:hypothetical protein
LQIAKQDYLNSHFNGNILFLLPDVEQKSSRMTLLKSHWNRQWVVVTYLRSEIYVPSRDPKPDVVITSNPHLNPHCLLESLSALSANGNVPIILDLDADFEKQPISHPEYNTKGLGHGHEAMPIVPRSRWRELVTVPSAMYMQIH